MPGVPRPRRNTRPRDRLGRPLPYGSPGAPEVPEGVSRTPEEALTEAQRLLDTGFPFAAHEILEDAWKSAAEDERELWRGLAQLAVGLTHAERGNGRGGPIPRCRNARSAASQAKPPRHTIVRRSRSSASSRTR